MRVRFDERMEIPFKFYLRYWILNSTMALGTGFVIAILFSGLIPVPLLIPIVVLVSFFLWQFAAYKYFFGKSQDIKLFCRIYYQSTEIIK